ncbi:unannotated protein [freshwater metagenome]|uniref:Unannotated protein n=1 Tax=freshwater metagenome TaxID=449393 RepID=A0A6J6QPW4_9ZZZZ
MSLAPHSPRPVSKLLFRPSTCRRPHGKSGFGISKTLVEFGTSGVSQAVTIGWSLTVYLVVADVSRVAWASEILI